MRLIACPACSQHVRVDDSRCPHCAAPLGTTFATAPSIVLLGLALAGCPADDYREDLPPDTTETSATLTTSTDATTIATDDSTGTSTGTTDTSIGSEAAYGVPETESDSITDSADSTSTSTGSSTESGSSDTTDGSTTTGTDGTSSTSGAE